MAAIREITKAVSASRSLVALPVCQLLVVAYYIGIGMWCIAYRYQASTASSYRSPVANSPSVPTRDAEPQPAHFAGAGTAEAF